MQKSIFIFLSIIILASCGDDNNQSQHEIKTWENGEVYYHFSDDIAEKEKIRIERVFDEIEDNTKCVYFIKEKNNKSVVIGKSKDGSSCATVGYCKENYIKFKNDATERIIYHEIFHVLGLSHEHQRLDRDDYIKVFYENIIQSEFKNFDITQNHLYDTELFKYDKNSIMHYSTYSFSANGEPTIIFHNTKNVYGLRGKPTIEDYNKLISIYIK